MRTLLCISFVENCTRLCEVEIELFKKCVSGGGNLNEVTNLLLLLAELAIP